jgi:hypothetical protein
MFSFTARENKIKVLDTSSVQPTFVLAIIASFQPKKTSPHPTPNKKVLKEKCKELWFIFRKLITIFIWLGCLGYEK